MSHPMEPWVQEQRALAAKERQRTRDAPFTRESLHARIADVLRRSGVEDAERLVRALEQDWATIVAALVAGLDWADLVSRGEVRRNAHSRSRANLDAMLIGDAIAGNEIGPPKPASEPK